MRLAGLLAHHQGGVTHENLILSFYIISFALTCIHTVCKDDVLTISSSDGVIKLQHIFSSGKRLEHLNVILIFQILSYIDGHHCHA